MPFELVTNNVYAMINGVNTTALVLPAQVVMIDAGARRPPAEMQKVRKQIEALANKPVKTVILTHFHSDHTHSLPFYADCTIIASTRLAKHLHDAKRKTLPGFPAVIPLRSTSTMQSVRRSQVFLLLSQSSARVDIRMTQAMSFARNIGYSPRATTSCLAIPGVAKGVASITGSVPSKNISL
jgi:ribonuclease BN (tRNA processing enzyme)